MHRGVRFRCTPEQLGLPPEDWTADRSYAAWREWLQAATKHFDATGQMTSVAKPPQPKRLRRTLAEEPRSQSAPRPNKTVKRFEAWRDDPDYPRRGVRAADLPLDELRSYMQTLNALSEAEPRVLKELRAASGSKRDCEVFLEIWTSVCGPRNTIRERCHAIETAKDLIRCASLVTKIRPYASESAWIAESFQRVWKGRVTIKDENDVSRFGGALEDVLVIAEFLSDSQAPPIFRGWEGPPRYRWTKMHNGVRLRATCADLGLPEERWTAAGSSEAWLAWLNKARSTAKSKRRRKS